MSEAAYEYNAHVNDGAFAMFDWQNCPYTEADIKAAILNPMFYNRTLRKFSWWAYRTDGSVASIVSIARSIFTLDSIVVSGVKRKNKKRPRNFANNSALLNRTLNSIRYKELIRDMILRCCLDGTYFYYLETKTGTPITQPMLTDYDVAMATEINSDSTEVLIIPLPVDYCRIVGRNKHGYIGAFDLSYFKQFTGTQLEIQLRSMPAQIREAYQNYYNSGTWVILDNTHTLIGKIRTSQRDPWGEPLVIAALNDVLYADYFVKTKRNLLDEVNSQIIYETFPEGAQKGTSALTDKQQVKQHETLKAAILKRQNQQGTTFFSLPAGTKIQRLEINTDLFSDDTESAVRDNVAVDIGVAPSALNGQTSGNYATASLNIEMFASRVYTWIEAFVNELNKAINLCVIRDSSCPVNIYIMPTTFANKDKFVANMKELYTSGKGSLTFWIAATGVDSNAYLSMMEYEAAEGYEDRFPVHKTSFTASATEDSGGRPVAEDTAAPSTISTRANGGNESPKPSE